MEFKNLLNSDKTYTSYFMTEFLFHIQVSLKRNSE